MADLAHNQKILASYQQQLHDLEQQIALVGGRHAAPLHLISQYAAIEQKINALATQLPAANPNQTQQLQHAQALLATYQQQLQQLEQQITQAGGQHHAPLAMLGQHAALIQQINQQITTIEQLAATNNNNQPADQA